MIKNNLDSQKILSKVIFAMRYIQTVKELVLLAPEEEIPRKRIPDVQNTCKSSGMTEKYQEVL